MKKYITILFFMVCSTSSFSQVELGSALEGTLEDATILLKGYVRPLAEGFGYSVMEVGLLLQKHISFLVLMLR